jgi:hypothetical protein
MFEEYAVIVNQLGLAENLQEEDDTNIPKELILLRNCVDMYEQEYMVKVKAYLFKTYKLPLNYS